MRPWISNIFLFISHVIIVFLWFCIDFYSISWVTNQKIHALVNIYMFLIQTSSAKEIKKTKNEWTTKNTSRLFFQSFGPWRPESLRFDLKSEFYANKSNLEPDSDVRVRKPKPKMPNLSFKPAFSKSDHQVIVSELINYTYSSTRADRYGRLRTNRP